MARDQSAFVSWVQYFAARSVASFVHSFDVRENLRSAAAFGSLFWRTNARRRARAETNIARSFPEWPDAVVRRTAERSLQHMFQLFMVDSIVTPRLITPDTWRRHIRLGELQPVLERLVHGEPVLLLTGHYGNWELLGYALSVIGFPLAALARPLDNPYLDRWLRELRERRGMRIITKWGATPILQQILDGGGRVGFIADQNAGDQGLFVPFFGRFASSYKSIGLLAMRHDIPIAAGHATRLNGHFEYELEVTDCIAPDDWVDQPDPLFYITARYNRALEEMIRRCPEQYLWVHRRWKSRPRHEREGRPVPGRLIARLEALPWMTQDELDRIVAQSNEAAAAVRNGRH